MPPRIRVAIITVAVLGTLFALVAGTLWSAHAGISAAVGATIAASNLWALARIVGATARPDASKSALAWAMLALVKMLGLFALVWLLVRWGIAQPLPMVLGYGALPIGIAVGSVVSDRTEPPSDDTPEPDSHGRS
jgi:hypothetical protein